MNPELLQALLSITFGAIAGGVTNAVAVWMLFHPYEAPRLFGRRIRLLQGAIPKNKERLAGAIGRTVGTKLLTGEDLAHTIREPAFRNAFDDQLRLFITNLFEQERASLLEVLSPALAQEVRGVLERTLDGLLERLDAYLATEEFRAVAHRWAEQLATELRDQPLGQNLLTKEREAALARTVAQWLEEFVEGESFAQAIRDYLDRGASRLLVPGRTFQEILPIGMVAAVERAIAGYLPIALERLSGMLDDPGARKRLERILHVLLDRFLADLKFHQRLVASLLITPETIDRVLRAVEREGAAKVAELMQEDEVRDAMARGVNNAIVDFLGKPVTSVLGNPGDASVESAKDTIATWVLNLARDEQSRHFLIEKLVSGLNAAEQRTWGDVFRHLPPDRLADALVQLARSDRAGQLYREAGERALETALHGRIGRLADRLPADAATRLEQALAEPLWTWLQQQVPPIAQRVDIAKRVEQKILDFPVAQVEALIKGVTERELKLIVQLGYVLGALIGVVSAGISLIF